MKLKLHDMCYMNSPWLRIVAGIGWHQKLLVDSWWLFGICRIIHSRSHQNMGWRQPFCLGSLVNCRSKRVWGILVVVIWVDVCCLWHLLAFVHRAVIKVQVYCLKEKKPDWFSLKLWKVSSPQPQGHRAPHRGRTLGCRQPFPPPSFASSSPSAWCQGGRQ